MSEILDLLRILGPGRAIRMKQRYDQAQPYVRGYVATQSLWSLMLTGVADRLLAGEDVELSRLVEDGKLNRHVLEAVVNYLDGISLLRFEAGRVRLLAKGRQLLEDTRGLFELTYAYEPLFANLTDLLAGRKEFGRDVNRRIEYVGRGSGMLCRDLPYPVMADMIQRRDCRNVLDLGCGDLAFLFFLAERVPEMRGLGIDIDSKMIAYSSEVLGQSTLKGRIEAVEADMRNLDELIAAGRTGFDCVTAVDTFHEYLWDGEEQVRDILSYLRQKFPQALFVIGEFCNQPQAALRKRPTAFLEHHLFHDLSNQKIGDAEQWRRLFRQAGFQIIEEKVFNLVGHGYFALRSAENA
jgi:SAM-dependent methyltransferase